MPEEFELSYDQRSDGVAVVAVRGSIDLFTAPDFKDGLLGVIDRGADRIVLDFSATSFLDSSALAVLLSARKRLAGRHGELAIAGLNASLETSFRLTGLSQLFTIESTAERAARGLTASEHDDE
jgi:anti-sigma B factor antagonist